MFFNHLLVDINLLISQKVKLLLECCSALHTKNTSNFINIIFERTSDIFTDLFSDNCFVAYKKDGVKNVLELSCSTKASLY